MRRESNPQPVVLETTALPIELRICEEGQHVRRESNPQPAVLETAALPIELRTYKELCERLMTSRLLLDSKCGGNRTPNRWFWRPLLYQLSYALKTVGTMEFRQHTIRRLVH